jgi:hypothetical protein
MENMLKFFRELYNHPIGAINGNFRSTMPLSMIINRNHLISKTFSDEKIIFTEENIDQSDIIGFINFPQVNMFQDTFPAEHFISEPEKITLVIMTNFGENQNISCEVALNFLSMYTGTFHAFTSLSKKEVDKKLEDFKNKYK